MNATAVFGFLFLVLGLLAIAETADRIINWRAGVLTEVVGALAPITILIGVVLLFVGLWSK